MLHQAILIVLGTAISPMLWMEQLWCKIGQIMSDRGGAYCCDMASMAAHCNVHHCHGNMEMSWWLQSLIVCLIEAMAVVQERWLSLNRLRILAVKLLIAAHKCPSEITRMVSKILSCWHSCLSVTYTVHSNRDLVIFETLDANNIDL